MNRAGLLGFVFFCQAPVEFDDRQSTKPKYFGTWGLTEPYYNCSIMLIATYEAHRLCEYCWLCINPSAQLPEGVKQASSMVEPYRKKNVSSSAVLLQQEHSECLPAQPPVMGRVRTFTILEWMKSSGVGKRHEPNARAISSNTIAKSVKWTEITEA